MHASKRQLRAALPAILAGALLAGPAAPSAGASATCANANQRPPEISVRASARSTVCLLNSERARRGLRELRLNRRLSGAARAHSGDMVRRHYFAHVSKTGGDVVDRVKRTGYLSGASSWSVGENLAWGAGSKSTPREIVRSWMHSPGHRHNILTARFREIGIGVVFDTPMSGGPKGVTYTTTFGARG